jgi:hypothetical protein
MRFVRTYAAVFVSLVLAIPAFSQQAATPTASSSPQAVALLQRSLVALTGGQSLIDVTLTGTARRIAGSDDETGTTVLKSLASDASRMDITLPSGSRTEIRANSASGPAGIWFGPDGVHHAIPQHNVLTDPSWFFPEFTLTRMLTDDYVVFYIGEETRDGRRVSHLEVYRQFQAASPSANGSPDPIRQLSTMNLYIDTLTLQPSALRFCTHPDLNQSVDIVIEIRFSDYRPASGHLIPFHIKRYLNNGLAVDLQIDSVTLNSGLAVDGFGIQ